MAAAPPPPKEPRLIATLWTQIMEHPRYPETTSDFQYAFMYGVVGGGSTCTTENNAWTRAIWRRLYLGKRMPHYMSDPFVGE